MVQTLGWIFAVVFLVLGVLGFVPGVTADGYLLGIFAVDPLHNVVHLLTGLVAALAAWSSTSYLRMFFKVFGIVYLLVAVLGFVQGDSVLGLISVNGADNILHIVIAAVALWAGFGMKQKQMDTMAPGSSMPQSDMGGTGAM